MIKINEWKQIQICDDTVHMHLQNQPLYFTKGQTAICITWEAIQFFIISKKVKPGRGEGGECLLQACG